MKSHLMAGIACLAMSAGAAHAEQLTVLGGWLGEDQKSLEAMLDAYSKATGHAYSYVGSDSMEQQIIIDVEAGSAPNITFVPQPGLAADLAKRGALTPLPEGTADWVKDNYAAGQSWADLGSFPDQTGQKHLYGLFYRVDLKSLVWYSPENFEDAGYEVPTTMEELKALSDKMVADGKTPWCIGLGSGAATGWPATDWVEDLLLRMQPPEVYDGWVSNKIPFNDPRIVAAIEEYGSFARNEKYVSGGVGAVSSTDFRDSPKSLFTSPPQCYMHRQASFIPTFFPEGTKVGVDADFFYFPSYASKDLGSPVLGAGTMAVITKDSPEARDFIKFLETPEAHEIWMARGGFLTPLKSVDKAKFPNDEVRKMNDILLNATTFRFDGSDQMPGAVGAGTFWTGMVDYTSGAKTAEQAADEIQASWKNLK
ncbi:ABC transporter substrate-binding protein [Pleomorphomonas sp. NRK KF1]|uniref:ABC transporter substrate-binding protein n=1 Tax=Pleomorphomonas sp. NRK KF1 TaxID=2943000 RepID=UPI0020432D3B|nr:ABC transporter substrate-binding protein [Pleomorphomonas sp. NRK KF1]MCM5555341.1 ABC transporter substrate-binding protein [Pleomorphomonas sp. NRK KF1]